MSSTLGQHEQHPPHCTCGSQDAKISDKTNVNMPSSSQIEDEYHALATQTADLDLKDQDTNPDLSSKDADDTWSDEEAPAEKDDENSDPKLAHATATAPADSVQVDKSIATTTKDAKTVDNPTTSSKDANPKPSEDDDDDETSTPRFQTYIKLHDNVGLT